MVPLSSSKNSKEKKTMATYIDHNGERQQVELNGLSLFREAADKKVSFRQLVNMKYPTQIGKPDAFQQMCLAAGLRFKKDEETGVPAASIRDIFDPVMEAAGGSYTNQPAIPDSRILFMPALMEVVENKLNSKEDIATGAFESLVGLSTSITGNRLEQPVLNYVGAKGPEDSQFSNIAQNTAPNLMLSLTASDISRKIPTVSIGMEVSYEALASNSIDVVAMALTRFYKFANYNEWIAQLGMLLSGDADAANTTMSNGTAALSSVTATSFDSTIANAAGVLTHKAWLAFLYSNSRIMTKTDYVCDFATALSIENRTGRPTNVMNNSIDRLDVPVKINYPAFSSSIGCVVMPVGTFPANTIMAIDKEYAIAKVSSTTASYEAIEDVVMRRSKQIRIDRGFITYRQYSDAFNVMTLT
jgi:hypothetical protein